MRHLCGFEAPTILVPEPTSGCVLIEPLASCIQTLSSSFGSDTGVVSATRFGRWRKGQSENPEAMSFARPGIALLRQRFFAALELRLVLGKSFRQKEKRSCCMRVHGKSSGCRLLDPKSLEYRSVNLGGHVTVSVAEHIERLGGVATSSQLKEAGFAPGVIEYALNSGKIDRLTRGVYCSLDVLDDEFAAVTMRWPKCILSHGTALYLLGLSDRVPGNLSVSVPRDYNPRELRRTHPDMGIHRESDRLYGLGKITVKDPMGIVVPTYDAERSIADIIQERTKGTVNPQLVRDAIVGYFRRRDRDLPKLAKMCEVLGVRDELQRYLEVLE